MNPESQKRFQRLLSSVTSELQPRTKKEISYSDTIFTKIDELSEKLQVDVKNKCSHLLHWLEDHSKPIKTEDNKSFKIVFAEKDLKESKLKYEELMQCRSTYTHGMTGYVDELNKNIEKSIHTQKSCVYDCIKVGEEKSDDQFKSCVTSCFTQYFDTSNNHYSIMDGRIDEILRKKL